MALFFDSQWFDARLAGAGLARRDVAAALGLTLSQIDELWKDQRELSVRNVRVLAGLLGVTGEEIAARAGISTPIPRDAVPDTEKRLQRIEMEIAEIKSALAALKAKTP